MTTMSTPVFTGPFGRLQPPSQEGWTPASAVSSFNLPLIYDSTLTTPISLSAESPAIHVKSEPNWHRTEPNTMQYPPRSYEGIYRSDYQSIHSKSKDSHLSSLSVPSDEMPLSISPYVFDSPQSQCPPTPYWGSFGVSAPQSSSTATAASTPPNSNLNLPSSSSGSRNQAPILQAPTPANLRPLKRAHDENLSPRAHQQAQEAQQQLQQQAQQQAQHQVLVQKVQAQQVHQQQLQQAQQHARQQSQSHIFSPHLKHESPTISPISTASATSHASKRRKYSSPPTPYSNPPSAHPSSSTYSSSYPTPSHQSVNNSTPGAALYALEKVDTLSDRERLLLRLKDERDEDKADWKQIAHRWKELSGKEETASCLQMRHFRTKERIRIWTDSEIRALISSKQKHGNAKWNTIAQGMLEFGCELKWSPRACSVKWDDLHPEESRGGTPRSGRGKDGRFSPGMRNGSSSSMEGDGYCSEGFEVEEKSTGVGETWAREEEERYTQQRVEMRVRGQPMLHGTTQPQAHAQIQGQQQA